jgi:hypothetical protein
MRQVELVRVCAIISRCTSAAWAASSSRLASKRRPRFLALRPAAPATRQPLSQRQTVFLCTPKAAAMARCEFPASSMATARSRSTSSAAAGIDQPSRSCIGRA